MAQQTWTRIVIRSWWLNLKWSCLRMWDHQEYQIFTTVFLSAAFFEKDFFSFDHVINEYWAYKLSKLMSSFFFKTAKTHSLRRRRIRKIISRFDKCWLLRKLIIAFAGTLEQRYFHSDGLCSNNKQSVIMTFWLFFSMFETYFSTIIQASRRNAST